MDWCQGNHLEINMGKTKELVVDFCGYRKTSTQGTIQGTETEMVTSYRYLGVQQITGMDCQLPIYIKKRSQQTLLAAEAQVFWSTSGTPEDLLCVSVMASVISYGVVCWKRSITASVRKILAKLIKMGTFVLGCQLDLVQVVQETRGWLSCHLCW